MTGLDVGEAGEVGDGAGDLDDAGVCAGGQAQAVDDALQRCFTLSGEGTEAFQELGGHLRVGEDTGADEAGLLDVPCFQDPGGDGGGRLALAPLDEGTGLHGMDPELQVDAVHDRPAELREIGRPRPDGAGTAFTFSIIAAGAGVGGGDEHEGSGVDDLRLEAGDGDFSVLQWPAEGLQRGFRGLAEFVGEEYAARCQTDLPGHDVLPAAPAQDGRLGGRYVRSTEGSPPHEPQMARCFARDRPNLGGDRRFLPRHRRQDARHGLCHGTFAGARCTNENSVLV